MVKVIFMFIFNKEIYKRKGKGDCWEECFLKYKYDEDIEIFYFCMIECGIF